jgi:serine/threonine-protein kinase
MAYQHVQETPPAPSSFNAAVPPAVDELVARALRKDPGHRFPDAESMRAECERVAGTGGSNTPLIIGEGPRVGGPNLGGSGGNALFPQAQGHLGTVPPAPQQPYQQLPPQYTGQQPQAMAPNLPPNMARTPPPYAPPQTPPPYTQGPVPPPYAQRPGPYRQPMPPQAPPMRQTPPPYTGRPGMQTPPPYRPTPPPQARPPMRPAQMPPRPVVAGRPGQAPMAAKPSDNGRGCGIAAIVIGVIVGVLILVVLIVVLVVNHDDNSNNPSYNGSGPLGPVASAPASGGAESSLIPGAQRSV